MILQRNEHYKINKLIVQFFVHNISKMHKISVIAPLRLLYSASDSFNFKEKPKTRGERLL